MVLSREKKKEKTSSFSSRFPTSFYLRFAFRFASDEGRTTGFCPTEMLARTLDSLVRVTRRVDRGPFLPKSISNARARVSLEFHKELCNEEEPRGSLRGPIREEGKRERKRKKKRSRARRRRDAKKPKLALSDESLLLRARTAPERKIRSSPPLFLSLPPPKRNRPSSPKVSRVKRTKRCARAFFALCFFPRSRRR